uniref:Cytochrome b n=1 Tax=Scutopus robustus TaxID=2109553 RepID=A0A343YNB3_9MOLL|nr:cytochrome b [Scutopus robustus]AWL21420.1 cytochrome b [Scutopus robustus]
MLTPARKKEQLLVLLNDVMVDLPSPSNISLWWNLGSLLGLCLVVQLITGVMLSFHYCPDINMGFESIVHITKEVNMGWLMRSVHVNGASLFFFFLYAHVGRGLYYGAFFNIGAWQVGVLLLALSMGIAFLGYILPWGQMSFWGATVITSMLSAVPYVGGELVEWLWGGYSVGGPTLTRFYSLHFLTPFVMVAMVGVHVLYLHQEGSNNPLGVNKDKDKIPFHPFYSSKDVLGFFLMSLLACILVIFHPFLLVEVANSMEANVLVTPSHIQPEWYFLFAYTILRSIPNKLGGVMAMCFSVLILCFVPVLRWNASVPSFRGMSFAVSSQIFFFFFLSNFVILTWIGSRPVMEPFVQVGQVSTFFFFLYFLCCPIVQYVSSLRSLNWA